MNYKVLIKSPNKMFVIKNKPIRSPLQTIVNEKELILIKSRIKFYGLSPKDYEISLINDSGDFSIIESVIIKEEIKVQVPIQELMKDKNIIHNPTANKKQPIISKLSNDSIEPEEQIKKYDDNMEIKIEELSTKSLSILESFLHTEI